jgi:hypothetical protein
MNLHRQPPGPEVPGVCAQCEGEADLAVSPLCRDCTIAATEQEPQFRCACVHRDIYTPELAHLLPANPWEHRCKARATQEDGLCDHCRQSEGCPCCAPAVRSSGGGCRWHGSNRYLVPLDTPCMAVAS